VISGPVRLDAIDSDSAMVRRAERRLARFGVYLAQGGATCLPLELEETEGCYDAVFAF
jgi:hypothetical protein